MNHSIFFFFLFTHHPLFPSQVLAIQHELYTPRLKYSLSSASFSLLFPSKQNAKIIYLPTVSSSIYSYFKLERIHTCLACHVVYLLQCINVYYDTYNSSMLYIRFFVHSVALL